MKVSGFALLAFACLATDAHAQQPADQDRLRTSLSEMLSLLTFGTVSVPGPAVQVTQTGDGLRLLLPLNGFIAPAGASAEALVRPENNGVWTLASLTFPPAGALGSSIDNVVSYTIGRQATRGRLDPKPTMPSTIVSALDVITLRSATGEQTTEQSIEHVTLDSLLSGRPDSRVDLHVQDVATNWHVVARDPDQPPSDGLVRQVTGQVALGGLDRAQASRLVAAARSLAQTMKSPDHPSDAERAELRGMLDATAGLLTRIDANETLDGLRVDLGHGNTATLDHLRLHLRGAVEEQRLNAAAEFAADEPALTSLPPDSAAFVPHHLFARSILAGIPLDLLTALLRSATGPDPDQAALRQQVIALLNAPGATAAIESIAFDAGPLRVEGSARVRPRADGEAGADIHVSASGIDAALVQLQGNPNIQGIMPLVFLAKGLGRADGDRIVWDISLGGGPVTINGVPFGQPLARTR